MNKPVLVDVGITKVGEHWDKGFDELVLEASKDILDKVGSEKVDAVYVGTALSQFFGQQLSLGSYVADRLGLYDVVVSTFEAGGASSAQAFYNAILGLKSGEYKYVLVIGVEKMSDELPSRIQRGLSLVEDSFIVDYIGVTRFSLHGLAAKMYMKEYGVKRASISQLPVLEHRNAAKAGHAQFRREISLELVLNTPPIADPLTIFDVTAPGDGAATLLLASEDEAKENGWEYVPILGFGSASQRMNILSRSSPLFLDASARAVDLSLKRAGLTVSDINHVEMYNPTSISGILILESIGLANRGSAGDLIDKGYFSLDGEVPINTFGGAKARGDPVGAASAYQIAEAFMQLKGEAGDNQVDDVEVSLVHSMVGFDNSAYSFILGGVEG